MSLSSLASHVSTKLEEGDLRVLGTSNQGPLTHQVEQLSRTALLQNTT